MFVWPAQSELVNCSFIISGSNDSNEIMQLHKFDMDHALGQFRCHVDRLLVSLLQIPNSFVILPSIFPRFGLNFDLTNSILEDIVRYLV